MRDHAVTYKPPLERARYVIANPGAHPLHQIRNAGLYLLKASGDDLEMTMARALVAIADRRPAPVIGISKRLCGTIAFLALALGTCARALLIP